MRVLDLGSGGAHTGRELFPRDEVVEVDSNPGERPDVVADVRELPEDLGVFDVVVASHILEHIAKDEAVATVRHWMEFIRPGGALQILVPDLMWAAEQLIKGNGVVHPAVLGHLFGGQQTEGRHHKCGYTAQLLRDLLQAQGLWVEMLETAPFTIMMGSGDRVVSRQVVCVARKLAAKDEGRSASVDATKDEGEGE